MATVKTTDNWQTWAALYESLALGFVYPDEQIAQVLKSGDYAAALAEILDAIIATSPKSETPKLTSTTDIFTSVSKLEVYKGKELSDIRSELRREHTRLFIGTPNILVAPYGGNWLDQNKSKALLFVNAEALAVEKFMHSCGVGQPKNSNEPLDHIASELEFLQYLCALQAGIVAPSADVIVPDTAYADFYTTHFTSWVPEFAQAIKHNSNCAFFQALADVLAHSALALAHF